MADLKVKFATGKKNGIEAAKESGLIDANDFVVTSDTDELAFINKSGETKFIKSKSSKSYTLNGTSLGSLASGQTIPEGIDMDGLLNLITQKEIKATYTKPSVSIANNGGQASGAVEAGTSITPKLRATFNKNDAGNLTKLEVLKAGQSLGSNASSPYDYTGEAIVVGDETITFTAKATYAEGEIKNNNLGKPSPDGHITAGSVTSGNYSITGQRNMFYGTGVGKFENADSSKIRALTNKRLNHTAGLKISLKVETGQQYIVFALPSPRTLTQVIYDDLGDKGMLSSFVKSTVQVADARGEQNGLKDYNCYVYNMATPAQAPLNFTFIIG